MNSRFEPQSNDNGKEQHKGVMPVSPFWEYVAILLRGKWIILTSVCLFTGLAGLYSINTKPYFEASSLVLVEMKENDRATPTFDFTGEKAAAKLGNEIEILRSRSTLQAVAEALRSIRYLSEKKTRIIPIISLAEKRDGDSLASVHEIEERLSGIVDFTPVRESDIIKISARSKDALEAVLIANIYTETYAAKNIDASRVRTTAVREFLQTQLQSKKTLLDSAENALQEYMRSSGVVSLDAEGTKVVDQLSALEAQRDAIEVEKSSRLKTLASYKEEFEKLGQSSAKAIEESNDSYIALFQDQIAKLEVQRDIVIAQNPGLVDEKIYSDKLKEINQQIASLKKTLTARTEQFLKSVSPGTGGSASSSGSFLAESKQKIIEQSIDLQALDARKNALDVVIKEYEKKFNQIPKKSIDLARLQRTRMSNEKLYLIVQDKFNEMAIQEKSEFGYVTIIDPAVVPERPLGPRTRINLIAGFMGGLVLGVFITFVLGFLDVRIRTPDDLKRNGFTPLSSISGMGSELKKIRQEQKSFSVRSPLDEHLVVFHRPMGTIAESYRHLRTNVLSNHDDAPPRCVIVTSAVSGEGKTTTACNLAISISQTGRKVLLVNADLRRPMLHQLFALDNKKGLAGYLAGTSTLDEVRQRDVLENLDIIAAREMPAAPAELLGSNRMREFIQLMKTEYDIVLIDAPPLLVVTDAAVLLREADGVLVVASAGTTRVNALLSASEVIHNMGATTLGVVLNNFDIRDPFSQYAAGHAHGYYGYESGYYGMDEKEGKSKR